VRVLVDTNVILDFLLEREPFFHDVEALFQEIASGQIIGYATATTLTDVFYIARRHTQSIERARQVIAITLSAMEICPVDRSVLELALASTTSDFEDAVQIACASVQGLDAIVTRDAELSTTLVPVLSVSQVLQQLESFE
jgi:predicted nucleic acid-binding protein